MFCGPGSGLRYDRSIGSWVATRPLEGKPMSVVVRSYRELRRFKDFGRDASSDLMFRWLRNIQGCEVFYDVGASIGIFGFGAHHLHGATSVFIEPFASSIESLLKSIYVSGTPERFEVIQAAVDSNVSYNKLYIHSPPKPGVTKSSFKSPEIYTLGGRHQDPVYATQWLPGLPLDHLIFECGFPSPTYLKMDVDGFEGEAIKGAKRLIEERTVRSYAIEINGEQNLESISRIMERAGYNEIAHQRHPGGEYFVADFVFCRDDLVGSMEV